VGATAIASAALVLIDNTVVGWLGSPPCWTTRSWWHRSTASGAAMTRQLSPISQPHPAPPDAAAARRSLRPLATAA
jgi:hypothetical protein